jgi:hypothetical protein
MLLASAEGALAQDQDENQNANRDAEAPSQALASDPAPPIPHLSVTIDPVGMAFAEWTAHFEMAPASAHAFFVEAGYRDGSLSRGIALELGYHLFVLGDGLDGPFVGPSVGAAVTTDRAEISLFGALEAGWQLALGPFALGFALGIEAHVDFTQETSVSLAPRLSVFVGYVLR